MKYGMKTILMRYVLAAALVVGGLMMTTGCKEVMSKLDNPVSSYLEMQTSDVELLVGQKNLRAATTISSEPVRYASADESVAVVDELTGLVTAVGTGTTTIIASVPNSADGCYLAGMLQYTVSVKKIAIDFDKSDVELYVGDGHTRQITYKELDEAVVTYVSDNPAVATVDAVGGQVVAVAPGVANVKVRVTYADFYVDESVSYQVSVFNLINLASLTADYEVKDFDRLYGSTTHALKMPAGTTVCLAGVDVSTTDMNALSCAGNATVILAEGTTNTLKSKGNGMAGIKAGSAGTTLTIKGAGSLDVTGAAGGAGIGTDKAGTSGDILIESGNIVAQSIQYGAGIGTGDGGICGNISIAGGTVTATGGYFAAGIGSGDNYSGEAVCGNITISGGTVTAKGGDYAAGIGTGVEEMITSNICGNISITGGTIVATGYDDADDDYDAYDVGPGCNLSEGTLSVGTVNVTTSIKNENGDDAKIYGSAK